MSLAGLEKAGAVALAFAVSSLLARWRVARRERAERDLPLFDAVLLEAALAPRAGEDAAFLAGLRDTIAACNRRGLAEEFAALPAAIMSQSDWQRETLRRALARLSQSGDAALERLAADTEVAPS